MSVPAQLQQLEETNLVRLAQTRPELEYLFRHALIRDAAYFSILQTERRALHHAIGETVERLYPEQQGEVAAVLAYHFHNAGDRERAGHYFTLAGDRALAAFANQEAEGYYRAALELAETPVSRAALLTHLGEALHRQDYFEEALQTWQQAIPLLQEMDDSDGLARLFMYCAQATGFTGLRDNAQALAYCQQGLASVQGRPETAAVAALLAETARVSFWIGQIAEARSLCQEALTMAERLGDVPTQANALATLWGMLPDNTVEERIAGLMKAAELAESAGLWVPAGRARHNLGYLLPSLRAGRAQLLQAVELGRRIGSVLLQIRSMYGVTMACLNLGELDAAEKNIATLYTLLKDLPNPEQEAGEVRFWDAMLLRQRGQVAEAVQRFGLEIEMWRQQDQLNLQPGAVNDLADALLELDELAAAADILTEALAMSQDRRSAFDVVPLAIMSAVRARQGDLAEAHRLLAEAQLLAGQNPTTDEQFNLTLAAARLAMAQGRWSEALSAFEETTQMLAAWESRWYQAQYQREWAEVYLARGEVGDREQAIALLETALAACQAMNLPIYEQQIAARLATL